jgi:hypothetical protein
VGIDGGTNVIPKVFVGTMYSGEGDFIDCCCAIEKQVGVTVTHHIIKDKPEKEAHNALWSAWRNAKQEHDMFVKVDADTVLINNAILFEFWNVMQNNSRVTGIQAPLLDYFTDSYINGLNCFSPKVVFQDTTDELFCDRRVDVNHDIIIKSVDVPQSLKPAGYHCHKATPEQAFHFGLHRALKNQHEVMSLVRAAWIKNKDKVRGMALLGASMTTQFRDSGFNYTDEKLHLTCQSTIKHYDELIQRI